MVGHEKSLSSPKKSIYGLGAILFLLTTCCSLIAIAGCSTCGDGGDGRAGAGKFQQGGRYERSDEDLEKLPEKDPRRLEPQPHFKKFRPEEPPSRP